MTDAEPVADASRSVVVREARTSDVVAIRTLVDTYTEDRILLAKATVTLYEDVQEFYVAEVDGRVVGCGALHVLWEDLAEVRTLAVEPAHRGHGLGHLLLQRLVRQAREVGVTRLFTLTFETDFFSRHGFREIEGIPVAHDVFEQLLQSYDEGVAEFLGLERVKPNTLGNSRMLLRL
ncbi:MAG: amino-acid N-acetyltransferase [Actinomycetota bacterium]|nr:amino-acid N-acetyltransferase [Actinomycetota bacterium]MDH4353774.1 amino-acid N-acetyltransferase [Actinomycetota bacterium]